LEARGHGGFTPVFQEGTMEPMRKPTLKICFWGIPEVKKALKDFENEAEYRLLPKPEVTGISMQACLCSFVLWLAKRSREERLKILAEGFEYFDALLLLDQPNPDWTENDHPEAEIKEEKSQRKRKSVD
jgi:hypothetical protein